MYHLFGLLSISLDVTW